MQGTGIRSGDGSTGRTRIEVGSIIGEGGESGVHLFGTPSRKP